MAVPSRKRATTCVHRTTRLQQDRSIFQDNQGVDFDLMRSSLSKIKDKNHRRIVNYHATLSTINNSTLHTFGRTQSPCCECGALVQDDIHLLWHCPITGPLRANDPIIAQLERCSLPKPTRVGIPLLMKANPSGDLWGYDNQTFEQLQRIFGVRPSFNQTQINADNTYNDLVDTNSPNNARQFVALAKGPYIGPNTQLPTPCNDNAPEQPNVWTDGSLKTPTQHAWSLGGFGVLHEDARADDDDLHHNEFTFACNQNLDSDLHIWGPISGPRSFSTRTEIAGGLIALSRPRPIHIASDSKCFINTLNKILHNKHNTTKPWSLVPNGDLLEY